MANAQNKKTKTAAVLFTVVAGMVGLAFASVPLIQAFSARSRDWRGTPGVEADSPGNSNRYRFQSSV